MVESGLSYSQPDLWITVDKYGHSPARNLAKKRERRLGSYIGEVQINPPYIGGRFLRCNLKWGLLAVLVHIFRQLSTVIRGLSTVFENLSHSRRITYPY